MSSSSRLDTGIKDNSCTSNWRDRKEYQDKRSEEQNLCTCPLLNTLLCRAFSQHVNNVVFFSFWSTVDSRFLWKSFAPAVILWAPSAVCHGYSFFSLLSSRRDSSDSHLSFELSSDCHQNLAAPNLSLLQLYWKLSFY